MLSNSCSSVSKKVSKTVWHRCLGHHSMRILEYVLKSCSLPYVNEKVEFCDSCRYGKAHSVAFPNSNSRVTKLFDVVY